MGKKKQDDAGAGSKSKTNAKDVKKDKVISVSAMLAGMARNQTNRRSHPPPLVSPSRNRIRSIHLTSMELICPLRIRRRMLSMNMLEMNKVMFQNGLLNPRFWRSQ
ncbi:hypothetical protein QQ045_016999 [Rhodiola kirilowii]